MINKFLNLWNNKKAKQQKELLGYAAQLKKDIEQFKKDTSEKSNKLFSLIHNLEAEIVQLKTQLNCSDDKEQVRIDRIIETKQERLVRLKRDLVDHENRIKNDLDYMERTLSRSQSKLLELDVNEVMAESEESLHRYRLMKNVVESIKTDQENQSGSGNQSNEEQVKNSSSVKD